MPSLREWQHLRIGDIRVALRFVEKLIDWLPDPFPLSFPHPLLPSPPLLSFLSFFSTLLFLKDRVSLLWKTLSVLELTRPT